MRRLVMMTSTSRSVALAASAFALASTGVIAQSTDEVPEVKIVASKPMLKAGQTAGGQPVEVVALSHVVNYADLNIATPAGVTELEKRINDAAKSVCRELELLMPRGTSQGVGSGSCVNDATADAMAKAKVAIAAAESNAARR
jgi:UrcA family protein